MQDDSPVILLSDAGPLITLAYADALDVLLLPGWRLEMVDMVLHEVTRNETPTSQKIADWVARQQLRILDTTVFERYNQAVEKGQAPRKSNLGELAVQEVMTNFELDLPQVTGVFLFEDHKIARDSFLLPVHCHKISTRSFLQFLEEKEWLDSATEVERKAIQAGRAFSQLRFSQRTKVPMQTINNFLEDIQSINPLHAEIIDNVRELFQQADPALTEDIKYGGLAFFKAGVIIGGIYPSKKHVSIEFSSGADFSDPDRYLEGKGKLRRHLKIKVASDIEQKQAAFYIGQAVETIQGASK